MPCQPSQESGAFLRARVDAARATVDRLKSVIRQSRRELHTAAAMVRQLEREAAARGVSLAPHIKA